MGDRDDSNGTIIFLLLMILGVLMYGKEQMGAMFSNFFWTALIVGIAVILIWIAWTILAGILEFLRECIAKLASATWGGQPIFTARRMTIVVGLAAVSGISFYWTRGAFEHHALFW